eukprot:gene3317-6001_t
MAATLFQRNFRVYEAADGSTPFTAGVEFQGGQVLLVHRPTQRGLHFYQAGAAIAQLAQSDVEELLCEDRFVARGDVYGCLGLLSIPTEDERWIKTLAVVKECKSHGRLLQQEIYHISAIELYFVGPMYSAIAMSHSRLIKKRLSNCHTLYHAQLFASGSFFFSMELSKSGDVRTLEEQDQEETIMSWRFDLTSRIQLTLLNKQTDVDGDLEHDERFWWSRVMWNEVQKHGINCMAWLIPVTRGSVELRTIYVGASQAKAALISRLSCQRAGTRFNARGVDDDGNAANFVETEQLIVLDESVVSYVITRGSVPIFWEQQLQSVGHQKPQLTREFEATKPAFDKHMEQLTQTYGEQTLISLLGYKSGERLLQENYRRHALASMFVEQLHHIDIGAICRSGDKIEKFSPALDEFETTILEHGFLHAINAKVERVQEGSFRINCLDCLDRSNVCQSAIGLKVLSDQLATLNSRHFLVETKLQLFTRVFKEMWQRNGDNLARCVTGSGALRGGMKTSILKDVQRSITRTLRGNFFDRHRQAAIDIVLGTYVEDTSEQYVIPDATLRDKLETALAKEQHTFTTDRPIQIVVGTWNVNAQKPMSLSTNPLTSSLYDWLHTGLKEDEHPDLFVIGLQEMIDLKAKNMLARSSAIAIEWAQRILQTIGREKYFFVLKQQLVGVCMFVFARTDHKRSLRDVRTHSVKTGAGGKMGNKGGVAMSFRFHSTPICFICAHLAAGKSNLEERNQDYHDITTKINFGKGRKLDNHELIVWLGDFNYRIEGSKDLIRAISSEGKHLSLLCKDQLSISRADHIIFHDFEEAPISFPPTYKYDVNSDNFDTSEKQRAPAWTDRILYRGRHTSCVHYTSIGSLKMSDHRPVTCVLKSKVVEVDKKIESKIREDIMKELRRQLASVLIICPTVLLRPADLEEVLKEYGRLVMIDGVRNTSAMLATFEASEVAKKVAKLHGKEILGEKVYVYSVDGEETITDLIKQHYKRTLAGDDLFSQEDERIIDDDFEHDSSDEGRESNDQPIDHSEDTNDLTDIRDVSNVQQVVQFSSRKEISSIDSDDSDKLWMSKSADSSRSSQQDITTSGHNHSQLHVVNPPPHRPVRPPPPSQSSSKRSSAVDEVNDLHQIQLSSNQLSSAVSTSSLQDEELDLQKPVSQKRPIRPPLPASISAKKTETEHSISAASVNARRCSSTDCANLDEQSHAIRPVAPPRRRQQQQ